jgi:hypothetical protein
MITYYEVVEPNTDQYEPDHVIATYLSYDNLLSDLEEMGKDQLQKATWLIMNCPFPNLKIDRFASVESDFDVYTEDDEVCDYKPEYKAWIEVRNSIYENPIYIRRNKIEEVRLNQPDRRSYESRYGWECDRLKSAMDLLTGFDDILKRALMIMKNEFMAKVSPFNNV